VEAVEDLPEDEECPKNLVNSWQYRVASLLKGKTTSNSNKQDIIFSGYWEISPLGFMLSVFSMKSASFLERVQ
jgi:hypothetical protein